MGKTTTNRALGKAIAGAVIAALAIKIFFFDLVIAEGHSMNPAIKPGSLLVVCKAFYGIRLPPRGNYLLRWKALKKGDVVVFYTPLGEIAVKRCMEIVPGNEFIALGDNSSQSYDSRSYGPVPYNNIIGRVLGVK